MQEKDAVGAQDALDTKGESAKLVAFRLVHEGPDVYPKAFEGTGYALVFEDDGEAGYLYVTTEDFEEILDALGLYASGSPGALKENDPAYIVWNPALMKAGFYYGGDYRAVVDFKNARACCKLGQPPAEASGWCRSSHTWDPKMLKGMTFNALEDERQG